MSDRIKGFVVTLERDLRDDDAEGIKDAISMIKGVANVEDSKVSSDDHINRMQIRTELWNRVFKIFYPDEFA